MRSLLRALGALLWTIALAAAVLHLFGVLPPRELQAHLGGPELYDTHFKNFDRHRLATLIHVIFGALLAALIPLQLSERTRTRFLSLHRATGKIFVGCGLLAAGSGAYLGTVMPFGGTPETVIILTMTVVFFWCLFRAVRLAKARRVDAHRRWMVRAVAITLSIATQRLVFTWMLTMGWWPVRQAFWMSIAVALALNLAAAEWMIRQTRTRAPEPAVSR